MNPFQTLWYSRNTSNVPLNYPRQWLFLWPSFVHSYNIPTYGSVDWNQASRYTFSLIFKIKIPIWHHQANFLSLFYIMGGNAISNLPFALDWNLKIRQFCTQTRKTLLELYKTGGEAHSRWLQYHDNVSKPLCSCTRMLTIYA